MRNKYPSVVIVLAILFAVLAASAVSRAAPSDRSQGDLLRPSLKLKPLAGGLEPGAPPTSTYLFTLEDIYHRLASGAVGAQSTFAEPPRRPTTGTGRTLNEIMALAPAADDVHGAVAADVLTGTTVWGLTSGAWGELTGTMPDRGSVVIIPTTVSQTIATGYHNGSGYVQGDPDLIAGNVKYGVTLFGITGTLVGSVLKTGQTISFTLGDDGDLERGAAWPSPRFITSTTGVVTDTATGLVWLQNASCYGGQTRGNALAAANGLNSGECGLSDGSVEGDWRLPNVRELHSLIHYGVFAPALPNAAGTGKWSEGDPFTGVQLALYWSSATHMGYTPNAWLVGLTLGDMTSDNKMISHYVWPVRGGQ